MTHQNVRETLLNRAVTVIATEGLEKTTTKAIVSGTGINEVYIYRHFKDKDGLLSAMFDMLDTELFVKSMERAALIAQVEMDLEFRCRLFFHAAWRFLLGNREKCLAFARYYYSSYFAKYSAKGHEERFKPLVKAFGILFNKEADVWLILNHIYHVMLAFAVMVHNDGMSDSDENEEHVFRVIYASVTQYFKTEEGTV